ncbi:MAG: radical SAM protein [Lachnospiraceae bacterium]|nr:radical SAM protein [Lachnospiraceae bacterium]
MDTGCLECPRRCRTDRTRQKGYCGCESDILVTRAAPHMWEEPCISGDKGSGAVFFAGCNLHCVYCQNKAISDGGKGKKVSVERLAEIFLELQEKNVYNINLVTPTHYSYEIKEAVRLAKRGNLHIPVVYNCGGYESVETVESLEDTVDIWMPDFKYISSETARRYSNCPDYFERAVEALDEMVRQVRKKGGVLFTNESTHPLCLSHESGSISESEDYTSSRIMMRGVIVRHMLLPGNIGESKRILRFLHERYGNDIYISIMSQYTPMPHILNSDRFPELRVKVDREEYDRLVDFALKIGIENAFIQEEDVATESFIPAFDCEGV